MTTEKAGSKEKAESPPGKENNNTHEAKKKVGFSSKATKRIFAVVGLLIFLGIIIYVGLKVSQPKGDIIATINGEVLSAQEVEDKYSKLPEQLQALITKEAFVEELINVMILLQEAKEQGISVTEQEIDGSVVLLQQQAPTEEAFQQLLQERGITELELREQLHDQLLISALINDTVVSRVEVSDEDVATYYEANQEGFVAQEGQIQLRHILVNDIALAEDILKQLQDEGSFDTLAQEHSVDPGTAQFGGRLGFVEKGQMVPPFEEAAFLLEVGQLSGIVETPFGFHIIQRLGNTLALEDATELIKQQLLSSQVNFALQTYISQLRADADIRFSESEMVEEGPSSGGTDLVDTGGEICTEGGKPLIYVYSTSTCKVCQEEFPRLTQALTGLIDQFVVYHWELDTGDNLITPVVETGVSKEALAFLKAYNPGLKVPSYHLGCRFSRIGASDFSGDEQVQAFQDTLALLIG